MCLQDFEILTFAIPIFAYINYPAIYPFCTRKNIIFLKLDAFYHNLLKIHSIYVKWVPCLWQKNPDRFTNIPKKAPEKAGTYTYTQQMWKGPPQ